MFLSNILLKEKHITVNEPVPAQKMRIEMERSNAMPSEVKGEILNCVISLNVILKDESNRNVVEIKVSYLIIVKLEEAYSKELADRIFTVLNSVYIQSVNDLLREASYPPIPFNIKC